jgi:hypothetical protein
MASRYNQTVHQFDPMAGNRGAAFTPTASVGGIPQPRPPAQSQAQSQAQVPLTPDQLAYLQHQSFPSGMMAAIASSRQANPIRIWILDNSAAMNARDAHILKATGGEYLQNVDAVTRWEELKECVGYQADFVTRFGLPTRFALLNRPSSSTGHTTGGPLPQYFSLHQTGNLPQEQQVLQQVLSCTVPVGPTPLTQELRTLRAYIESIAPQLRARHHTVPIILATQGLPTNEQGETSPQVVQEFVQTLRSFEAFPVWLVLRLCSDDEQAFAFYNSLDAQVDLPCDVLDDFYGEALEVYLHNPWLTYALVLHRYREAAFGHPVLDVMDERALTLSEVGALCRFLFGYNVGLPDPSVDWSGFLHALEVCMSRERPHWNPVTKTVQPWINLAHLNAIYGVSAPRATAPVFSSPPTATPPTPTPPRSVAASSGTNISPGAFHDTPLTTAQLVDTIEKRWSKLPPAFTTNKPLVELLGTMDVTFPLVNAHEHFQDKFHPFAKDALASGNQAVLKRAVRKIRFFLHPDKLPHDFNEHQSVLCKVLWDTISEAWSTCGGN